MTDKISEPVGPQTPDVHYWRRSLRSPSHDVNERSSRIDGFTRGLRSRTPSPAHSKSGRERMRSPSPFAFTGGSESSAKESKKRATVASSLRRSADVSRSGKLSKPASELAFIEAEYIKNLQRQIYFLELETNYLSREQARKATELHPHMTMEANKMLTKLKEMQSGMDKITSDLKQTDSVINVHSSEKERLEELLNLEKENHQKDKRLMIEELLIMRKEKDRIEREIAHRNDQIAAIKTELDKSALTLKSAELKINTFKIQLEQRIEQHNSTQIALEEKQEHLAATEEQLRQMEEKFMSTTSTTITGEDKLSKELRDEVRSLHQKIKETELEAGKDRYLRDRVSDDMANVARENTVLNEQILDLSKELEREKELRNSADLHQSRSLAEVATLKEKLSENDILRNELRQERQRSQQYLEQLSNEKATGSEHELQMNLVKSRLSELEKLLSEADSETGQLRRDKALLVDNVAELHRKIEDKDREIMTLAAGVEDMETSLRSIDVQKSLEVTQHSHKWQEFSQLADSMKSLAQTMMAQTSHSPKSPKRTAVLY